MPASTQQIQSGTALYWARDDLRLADNPALCAAIDTGRPVTALYILDETTNGHWALGAASKWWLHHSLQSFAASLAKLNIQLVLRRGDPAKLAPALAAESGAARVFWNRRYVSAEQALDEKIKSSFKDAGIEARSFRGNVLAEPWEILTGAKTPYKVYSPFWRELRTRLSDLQPLAAPGVATKAKKRFPSDALKDWALTPSKPNWAKDFPDFWTPGEVGAQKRFSDFIDQDLDNYARGRDIPGEIHTSHLSPHLRFGEISIRQAMKTILALRDDANAEKFASELGWRDFAYYLLHHFPKFPDHNWRGDFDAFSWRNDRKHLRAWQQGKTGYPLVDAGMRELWATGYMHNRVRMVAASFLIKHLLIDWRRGEEWFWDTLVDADLANNSVSWQWVAGSGADAAPYFRIFNPVTQGERFDAAGAYVRRWIPELAKLPDRYIQAPWAAPEEVLGAAGVMLGKSYPAPIVDHKQARERALGAFQSMSKSRSVGVTA
ncbi:MAG: deoxyribodipyrimidine photo-lyase [Caulobacterales bacterium]